MIMRTQSMAFPLGRLHRVGTCLGQLDTLVGRNVALRMNFDLAIATSSLPSITRAVNKEPGQYANQCTYEIRDEYSKDSYDITTTMTISSLEIRGP